MISNGESALFQGAFNFSNVVINGTPGSNVTLTLSVVGIDLYGNSVQFQTAPTDLQVRFRSCQEGEAYIIGVGCQVCPPGTYLTGDVTLT
jgi:hypothetical protein